MQTYPHTENIYKFILHSLALSNLSILPRNKNKQQWIWKSNIKHVMRGALLLYLCICSCQYYTYTGKFHKKNIIRITGRRTLLILFFLSSSYQVQNCSFIHSHSQNNIIIFQRIENMIVLSAYKELQLALPQPPVPLQ